MTVAPESSAGAAADGRLEQLMALIARLAAAIQRENGLFQARRTRELESVLLEKDALADLYAREMRQLSRERDWLLAASPAMRQRFQDAISELRQLLSDYGRAILARRTVVEGLVRTLGQEVARQQQPLTAYAPGQSVPAGRPRAIAFDQRA